MASWFDSDWKDHDSIRWRIGGLSYTVNNYEQFSVDAYRGTSWHNSYYWTDSSTSRNYTTYTANDYYPSTTYTGKGWAKYGGTWYRTGSDYNVQTSAEPVPNTPSSPSITSKLEGGYNLDWTSETYADSYTLKVRRGYDSSTSYYSTTSSSYSLTGLQYGVTYYLSVCSNGSSGSSSYSSENAGTTSPKSPTSITFYDVKATEFSVQITNMEGNWDYINVALYNGSTHIVTNQIQNGYSTTKFTGLTAGVTYTVYTRSYFTVNSTQLSSVNQGQGSQKTVTVAEWKWTTANDVNGLKVAGNYSMGATEWNNFTKSINDHRTAKGLGTWSFSTANSGYEFTATMMNQAIDAIWSNTGVTRTKPTTKSRGNDVTVWDLNQMKYALDDIRNSLN